MKWKIQLTYVWTWNSELDTLWRTGPWKQENQSQKWSFRLEKWLNTMFWVIMFNLKWILWWLVIDMIQSLACGMETEWNILTVIRLIVNKSSPRCTEEKSWWLWRSDPVCTGSLWPSAAQSSSFILNTECTHRHSLRPRSSGPVQDDTAPPPPRPFIIVIATHSEWSCWTAAFDLKLNSFMSVH